MFIRAPSKPSLYKWDKKKVKLGCMYAHWVLFSNKRIAHVSFCHFTLSRRLFYLALYEIRMQSIFWVEQCKYEHISNKAGVIPTDFSIETVNKKLPVRDICAEEKDASHVKHGWVGRLTKNVWSEIRAEQGCIAERNNSSRNPKM